MAENRTSKSINIVVLVDYDRLSITGQFLTSNGNKEALNSFESKLMAAKESAAKGNTAAHNGQLQAFTNHVNAQSGKALTEMHAKVLNELAQSLMK